jgi:hypothetical protein
MAESSNRVTVRISRERRAEVRRLATAYKTPGAESLKEKQGEKL